MAGRSAASEINDAKATLHTALASSVLHGEHRVVENAGHGWLHEERQDAVFQAIADLLDRGRSRG
ncbi:hypothetical protein [Streptomyces sp. AK04-3B]|uniref:hypothetical protein n=1 Tax=unclassified Streptomyces TaxID=2593676 RepID=UPI0029ABB7FD|nr:hypothetical protein [Streptomyces sp. AK04-3B]MDX3798831.1 hypothetical protein [Streptomyces sp. AK04-3B]